MKINSPAINMINTQKWKGKMVAWTDGSKSSTKAVASVWINENNESNVSFDVSTHWEIDQIEATAIEAALHITPENENIIIITDSESTIKNLETWQDKEPKYRSKCNSADVIHRIFKIMEDKNLEVEFHHIFSHTDDSISYKDEAKRIKRTRIIRDRFGEFADTAIWGNKKVDELTHKPNCRQVNLSKNPYTHRKNK